MPQQLGLSSSCGLSCIRSAQDPWRRKRDPDALTNLVVNAIDAMPQAASSRFARALENTDADPAAAVPDRGLVEISDTGVGMTEEARRRCVEPFFTTKGERGTGLGLAMVYGMAQRHSADSHDQ